MSEIHAGLINPTEMLYTPTRESLDKIKGHTEITQATYIYLSQWQDRSDSSSSVTSIKIRLKVR